VKEKKMAEKPERPEVELMGTINEVVLVKDPEEIFLWCTACSVLVSRGFDLETSEGKAEDHQHGRTVMKRWD
jgi:hypothetical protein